MQVPEGVEYVPESDAPAENPTPEEYYAAQAAEYNTYVATGPIHIYGGRAFNEGHPVPVSTVERFPDLLAEGYVRRVDDAPAE
jgi:hypothetical protein